MLTRRDFIKWSTAAGAWLYVSGATGASRFLDKAFAALPGGTLDPTLIGKYMTPMLIPPVMPKAGTIKQQGWQERRLLRDLDEAVPAADSAGRHARDHGLGLRSGRKRQQDAVCCCTTRPR